MKIYEVYVAIVSEEGKFSHYEKIAVVDSKEKVDKKIAEFKKENEVGTFWMDYRIEKVNGKPEIAFKVEEIEVE